MQTLDRLALFKQYHTYICTHAFTHISANIRARTGLGVYHHSACRLPVCLNVCAAIHNVWYYCSPCVFFPLLTKPADYTH